MRFRIGELFRKAERPISPIGGCVMLWVDRACLLATATRRTLTTADASPGIERHGDRRTE
jgi:hypothetical protein